jgi:aryl-alcohol dehydrogenase-like predicted oxidoreductase
MSTTAELVLGTAQLGDPVGSPAENEFAARVIDAALNAGVRWIETSPAYGQAEARIGQALRGRRKAHIVTHLPSMESIAQGALRESVTEQISKACTRLCQDRLDVLVLRSVAELKSHNGALWRTLKEMRDEGLVYDLGVAAASPEEAMQAILDPAVTYLQIQFNAADWRWREAGVIDALESRPDILVHAHSALLYGMLAGAPGAKWPAANSVEPENLRLLLWTLAKDMRRDCPADLCIAYVRSQSWIHGVIAGARSPSQMALNLARFRRPPLSLGEIERINAVLPRMPTTVLTQRGVSRAA